MFAPASSNAEAPKDWWKPEWTARKKITLNTGADGVAIDTLDTDVVMLVRLAGGDFPLGAKEDGSDLRFLSADNKTEFSYHFERWDSLLNEAIAWVRVPGLASGATTSVWMYYGNMTAERAGNPKTTYDNAATGVYHFAETSGAAIDSSPTGVNAEGPIVPVPTALIGGGARFTGQNSLTIADDPAIGWTAGGELTISVWAKPAVLGPEAVILSRRDTSGSLLLGLDNGIPYLAVTGPAGILRTSAGDPVTVGPWLHLAVTSSSGTMTLFLNGKPYSTVAADLPGMAGTINIGKDPESNGFAGELDELTIANAAQSPGAIQFAAINQGGSGEAARLMVIDNEESSGGAAEHSEIAEHLHLIKGISQSLTIDGWIVIYCCGLLALVGWIVAIGKLIYLNKIAKASKVFLKQWSHISTDITALDHADTANVSSMGGTISGKVQRQMKESPLFHLYHLGSQEIQHRVDGAQGTFKGLSERSIGSIRALLEGGAIRETQKLQSKLVFLTIGIAGGPYLGLLGTVIGVMITFAVIARSGEVDINSIAPGIAGALLATVAGLAVAIPALFAYSYLAARIKDAILAMNTFIEEFIARIAEAYPSHD
ncbi:MAG: DUF2341 domain-containing protein [Verrucomicrobiales bacterium]